MAGAARATTGSRANQEDAFAIWPSGAQAATRRGEGLLAVVADGMGGHAGGEIAGDLACSTFVKVFADGSGETGERLRSALDAGNAAIAAHVAQNANLRGMGCTLIGAWIDTEGLHWVSVGDSLLLLFRAPEVLRLNADHSLGAYLDDQARRNKISASEAQSNPYRNALRSALTGKAIEILDLRDDPYPVADDDWIILASDGIGTLSGDEIGDIVYANRDADAETMAECLISAVLDKHEPEQDNTTVVVLKVQADTSPREQDVATRIIKHEPVAAFAPAPAHSDDDEIADIDDVDDVDDIETTQRIVQPPAFQTFLRRHRTTLLAVGMGVMFGIGWLLRALLG